MDGVGAPSGLHTTLPIGIFLILWNEGCSSSAEKDARHAMKSIPTENESIENLSMKTRYLSIRITFNGVSNLSKIYRLFCGNYRRQGDFRAPYIISFFPNILKSEHCNNLTTVKGLDLFTARRDKISGIGRPRPGRE